MNAKLEILRTVVLCDTIPPEPIPRFLFEETEENQASVLARVLPNNTINRFGKKLNTREQADQFVDLAKLSSWSELVIAAAPFHQLRAFLTMLGAMRDVDAMSMKIYNLPGIAQPWWEVDPNAKGPDQPGVRTDWIEAERVRILKYTEKGDLVTVDEALEYLQRRDTR